MSSNLNHPRVHSRQPSSLRSLNHHISSPPILYLSQPSLSSPPILYISLSSLNHHLSLDLFESIYQFSLSMAPRGKQIARKGTKGWKPLTTYCCTKSAPATGGVKVPTMFLPSSSSAPDIIELSSSGESSASDELAAPINELLDDCPRLGKLFFHQIMWLMHC